MSRAIWQLAQWGIEAERRRREAVHAEPETQTGAAASDSENGHSNERIEATQ